MPPSRSSGEKVARGYAGLLEGRRFMPAVSGLTASKDDEPPANLHRGLPEYSKSSVCGRDFAYSVATL
jgi:hypothetical protein